MRLMSLVFVMFAFLAGFAMVAPSRAADKPLETVASVDLERYLGRWYEIASYPAWFQKNCTAVTADYSLRENGRIKVINSCRKGSLDGKAKQSTGKAKVVDAATNALGQWNELFVIAAAVIGGTSFAGGIGTIPGAILGALFMQTLQSGMVLIGFDTAQQNIVVGLVLVIAVGIDTAYRRRASS